MPDYSESQIFKSIKLGCNTSGFEVGMNQCAVQDVFLCPQGYVKCRMIKELLENLARWNGFPKSRIERIPKLLGVVYKEGSVGYLARFLAFLQMEDKINIYDEETREKVVAHHRDGNKENNHNSNLTLKFRSGHSQEHQDTFKYEEAMGIEYLRRFEPNSVYLDSNPTFSRDQLSLRGGARLPSWDGVECLSHYVGFRVNPGGYLEGPSNSDRHMDAVGHANGLTESQINRAKDIIRLRYDRYFLAHRVVKFATDNTVDFTNDSLWRDAVCHHINGDKLDNRPTNVSLNTNSSHGKYHQGKKSVLREYGRTYLTKVASGEILDMILQLSSR